MEPIMQTEFFPQARFLIVDDEPANVRVLTQMLKEWNVTHIAATTDPATAAAHLVSFRPDVVLLDWLMPDVDGLEVMKQLQPLILPDDFLPILILTADTSSQAKLQALEYGAADFLTKPFDAVELSLRVHNLLSRRSLHRSLRDQNQVLDQKVQERTEQLEQAEIDTIECLARAAEFRDDNTGRHTLRVGHVAALIALKLGLDPKQATLIQRAASLHDVGKIGIADHILLKSGKLLPTEFEVMKSHALFGSSIMARHQPPMLQMATNIALTHHEHWNGQGYPNGLSSESIPLEGRIVAVADVFDALTHERPYKEAWPIAAATAEIEAQGGTQFDERVVEAFLTLPHETLI